MQDYSVFHGEKMTELLENSWNKTKNGSLYLHESAAYVFQELGDDYERILSVWFVAIGVFGFLANLLMLYLTRHSNTRRQLNEPVRTLRKDFMYFFIFNLAFSDAAGSSTGIPLLALELYFNLTIKNNSVCRVVRFSQLLFPTVTMFLLLLITIERYLSIVSPLFILRRSSARKIICLVWIWSSAIICLGLPSFEIQRWELDKQHFTLVFKYSNSGEKRTFLKILYLVFVFLAFLVPCFVVVTLSVYIVVRIRKRPVLQDRPLAAITNESEKLKTTKVILTVVAAFVLPYLAYIIYGVVSMSGLLPDNSYETDFVLRCVWAALVYSNVVINPTVIFVQTKSLRLRLRAMLGCFNQVEPLPTPAVAFRLPAAEISLQTIKNSELS